eukprot:98222-Prorocentrum_minimum.AAC.1
MFVRARTTCRRHTQRRCRRGLERYYCVTILVGGAAERYYCVTSTGARVHPELLAHKGRRRDCWSRLLVEMIYRGGGGGGMQRGGGHRAVGGGGAHPLHHVRHQLHAFHAHGHRAVVHRRAHTARHLRLHPRCSP